MFHDKCFHTDDTRLVTALTMTRIDAKVVCDIYLYVSFITFDRFKQTNMVVEGGLFAC